MEQWRSLGRSATFWWRDDDATVHTPQLERLHSLALSTSVPLALAAIPVKIESSLIDFVAEASTISVLQHGYAHNSFASPGQKKIEVGGVRETREIEAQLGLGKTILEDAFSNQFVPVLVPPWNRIESRIYSAIGSIGLKGVSSMWARTCAYPADSVLQINTHLDPVNWRYGGDFLGEYRAIAQLTRHLIARRRQLVDHDEPTGILTHHLVQTERVWAFTEQLFSEINQHKSAVWLDAREMWSS